MKRPKRLDAPANDAYAKAQRCPLRNLELLSEERLRALERDRPALVIVDGDAVLIGCPASGAINLQYGFPHRDAFARQFPGMLGRLVTAVTPEEAPMGFRLRLTDMPSRPYVEPVLAAHAFHAIREWLRMTLAELPGGGAPSDEVAAGFLLRPARPEDADAIAALEAAAFPVTFLTPPVARDLIERAALLRVLVDAQGGRLAGFLHLRLESRAVGYVSDLALQPAYRRRGLGEAMLRWALAWFRSQGMRSAALTVTADNGAAIALYRKLGFRPGGSGLDYRRPTDEEEVRQLLERQRTVHIRVRRRIS